MIDSQNARDKADRLRAKYEGEVKPGPVPKELGERFDEIVRRRVAADDAGHGEVIGEDEEGGEGGNAELLRERALRSLAVAIKASGGLLVRDVPKQLSAEVDRGRSITQVARRHRVRPKTLSWWRWQLQRRTRSAKTNVRQLPM